MTEFYIWEETDGNAQAMLDAINNDPRMPETMDEWATELTVFIDGRKGFKRIPEPILELIGITTEERDIMINTFGPAIIDMVNLPITVEEQMAIDEMAAME